MQDRLAAINARLDVTASEAARLAAERLSLEDERRKLERPAFRDGLIAHDRFFRAAGVMMEPSSSSHR